MYPRSTPSTDRQQPLEGIELHTEASASTANDVTVADDRRTSASRDCCVRLGWRTRILMAIKDSPSGKVTALGYLLHSGFLANVTCDCPVMFRSRLGESFVNDHVAGGSFNARECVQPFAGALEEMSRLW